MKGNKSIYRWLITGCILVALMVVIGGITRLTQSGLSMVEWKPIMGTLPPMNEGEWIDAFDKYKQSPEFEHFNYNFELSDFKSIFWWEYIHRLLARIIGMVFLIPFFIFLFKKKISKPLRKKLIFVFVLGAFQAVLGWFMVKSGLSKDPHVSHYRLAAHLITALALLCYIYWVALWVKNGEEQLEKRKGPFIKFSKIFIVLIFIQITYGALVAGLKAGLFYNTFPKMGDDWFPEALANTFNDYGLIGIFDSPILVQFMHRMIAYCIIIFAVFLWVKGRKANLNSYENQALNFVLIAVGIQFTLGVLTLLYVVPVSLGVIHQCGAILTLIACFNLIFILKKKKALNPMEA